MDGDRTPRRWEEIRAALRRTDDPYAGADPEAARRLVPLLAGLSTLLALLFLPMAPPTEAIGAAGWAVAGVVLLAAVLAIRRLARADRAVNFDELLAIAYLGVASVALLEWLAGGHSPYMLLYLLWVGAGVGVHPPRRAVVFIAVVVLATALPLAYDGWDPDTARDVAAASLLWLAMGLALMLLIASVRAQRVRFSSSERAAREEAEEAARRVRSFEQVTDVALAQLPLDALLHELLVRISALLELDAAAILIAEEDESLVARAAHGLDVEREGSPVRVRLGEGCAGRVAAERRTVRLNDITSTHDLDPLFAGSGVRALIGVPLTVNGRVIGVIEVGSRRDRHFARSDERLLQLAADRVAQAIERARLNERAHHIAETLQRALLPDRLPEIPGVKLAARYLPGGPGTDVGGDWYDVVRFVDGRVAVVMGDVVGRGISAAALMGQLRNAFRVYALEYDRPAAILDRMNVLLHDLDSSQMATAVVLVFDPADGSLCFASAGHPPPLVLRPNGEAVFLRGTPSVPLGIRPYGRYDVYEGELEPGDALLLYTDGLVERRGTSLNVGLDLLYEAVSGESARPDDLCDHVLGAVLPPGKPDDDVALLALQNVPVTGDRLHLELPADPDELATVRHTLERWLEAAAVSEAEAYRVTLACNEACMNAIEHAYRPGDAAFSVHAELSGGAVGVTVRDGGHWRPERTGGDGRGLRMMRQLMDDVDVSRRDDGTTVTMRRVLGRERGG